MSGSFFDLICLAVIVGCVLSIGRNLYGRVQARRQELRIEFACQQEDLRIENESQQTEHQCLEEELRIENLRSQVEIRIERQQAAQHRWLGEVRVVNERLQIERQRQEEESRIKKEGWLEVVRIENEQKQTERQRQEEEVRTEKKRRLEELRAEDERYQTERLRQEEELRTETERKQTESLRQEEELRAENERQLGPLFEQISKIREDLIHVLGQQFMIQPCFRCHEFSMGLLEISPNGRSVHYQCLHCKKKMHAAAGTPEAAQVLHLRSRLYEQYKLYREQKGRQSLRTVIFEAPAAPLPFEQTSRTPIPEAVRTEVWRRDGGKCVQCESKQNLQFDHIIAVTRGGATSVANLQLLCQPCNGSKSNRI